MFELNAVFDQGNTAGGEAEGLAAAFPTVEVRRSRLPGDSALPVLPLAIDEWESPDFDFWKLDRRADELAERGPFLLRLQGDGPRLDRAAEELLTRCQRLADRRNAASSRDGLFDRVLAGHRALHDLGKPLVRADYAHALDTWQWTLRLAPEAGLAVQLAALLHDVERLASEADARVEHRAADYQGFKNAHARRGAGLADALLARLGVDAGTRGRTGRLIERHELPPEPGDPAAADLALLNDADALSFFSLNSPGYLDYYGPEATRRKVAWTLARLRPSERRRLERMRLRPEVAAAVAAVLAAGGVAA